MENKELLAAERHSNIEMLSTLLEKVKTHDALVAKREALRQRLNDLDRKLATPAPKLKVALIIIFAIIAIALYFVLTDFVIPVAVLVVGLIIALVPFFVNLYAVLVNVRVHQLPGCISAEDQALFKVPDIIM